MSDKFERIKSLKDRLIGMVEGQVNGNIADVDAKELGEVVDMIKDLSEVVYYCSITDAMEKSSEEEKKYYMGKYEPDARYYTDNYGMRSGRMPRYYDDYSEAERKRDMDRAYSRMYFTEPTQQWSNNDMMRDSREGKSPISRRMYMETKDVKSKDASMKDLEKYIHDLGDDIFEMVENLDANDKAAVKTKIMNLATKIV